MVAWKLNTSKITVKMYVVTNIVFTGEDASGLGLFQWIMSAGLTVSLKFEHNGRKPWHRPECRDTSGTFMPFLARTFESSLAKVHKITKNVVQNRSAPLGSSNFTGKRLSVLVSVHMAFVEGMLIKQMRLFLRV